MWLEVASSARSEQQLAGAGSQQSHMEKTDYVPPEWEFRGSSSTDKLENPTSWHIVVKSFNN